MHAILLVYIFLSKKKPAIEEPLSAMTNDHIIHVKLCYHMCIYFYEVTCMNNFTYYTPTKVIFGKGVVDQLGDVLKLRGSKKVLVHFGGHSAVKSGLIDKVKKLLDDAGIAHIELGGVVPNPRIALVYTGIELFKKEQCDFILAVGGGSVIDSSKAIAYGCANEGDVWDFYEHTRKAKASMPVGVVLTIAASGSEMSDSSVITKEENGLKRGYNDNLCRPVFALCDPELTLTLPDYQTACGCTDIMMHTMERYFTSKGQMDITSHIAEGLLKTVMKNALILRDDPKNYDARAEVMWAGSLSHNGLTGCGNGGDDFASHRLEHELSGMFDVAHGAGLSALWGSWALYVYKECLPRFKRFAIHVMDIADKGSDEEIALKGIEATEKFFTSINMPTSFKELGVKVDDEKIKTLAHKCSIAVGGHCGSAKVLYEPDMAAIYKVAAEK